MANRVLFRLTRQEVMLMCPLTLLMHFSPLHFNFFELERSGICVRVHDYTLSHITVYIRQPRIFGLYSY